MTSNINKLREEEKEFDGMDRVVTVDKVCEAILKDFKNLKKYYQGDGKNYYREDDLEQLLKGGKDENNKTNP